MSLNNLHTGASSGLINLRQARRVAVLNQALHHAVDLNFQSDNVGGDSSDGGCWGGGGVT